MMILTSSKTVLVTTVCVFIGFISANNSVYAEHELIKQTPIEVPQDSHLNWHQFEHELSYFGNVVASMNSEGVLTLSGHVDDGITKNHIERLARKVVGVTKIRNLIFTD